MINLLLHPVVLRIGFLIALLLVWLPTHTQAKTFTAHKELCSIALNKKRTEFDTSITNIWVDEAKRQGLSVDGCRQVLGSTPVQKNVKNSKNIKDSDISSLCNKALDNGDRLTWGMNSPEFEFAQKALSLGYSIESCREVLGLSSVKKGATKTQISQKTISVKSNFEICNAALSDTKDHFNVENDNATVFITEARKRNLDTDRCRQELGLAPTQLSNAQTLETRQTLDDVESYLKTGSYSLDPLILVEKLTAVKTSLNSNDLNDLMRLRDDLKAYVETDAGYQKFLQNRVESAKEAEKLLAGKTLESAKQLISLSEDFVRKNVLSEKAPILVPLIKTLVIPPEFKGVQK
jgi:hypothetical protein